MTKLNLLGIQLQQHVGKGLVRQIMNLLRNGSGLRMKPLHLLVAWKNHLTIQTRVNLAGVFMLLLVMALQTTWSANGKPSKNPVSLIGAP